MGKKQKHNNFDQYDDSFGSVNDYSHKDKKNFKNKKSNKYNSNDYGLDVMLDEYEANDAFIQKSKGKNRWENKKKDKRSRRDRFDDYD